MVTSRTYHALHLDIASYPSERICYVILSEKLKESEHHWLVSMAEKHCSNFVIISGVNWETDLTPWKAPGLKGDEKDENGNRLPGTITGSFTWMAAAFKRELIED